jgi:hypothetical protein
MRIPVHCCCLLLLVSVITNAFVPQHLAARTKIDGLLPGSADLSTRRRGPPMLVRTNGGRTAIIRLLSSSNKNNDDTTTKPMSPTEIIIEKRMNPNFVPPGQSETEEMAPNKYPLDLPSPILLATSILLAIVSTGACYSKNKHPTLYHS